MILLMVLLSLSTWAMQAPIHWMSMVNLSDRHEFYKDHEVLIKPEGNWQTLFGIAYFDRALGRYKDCVYYYVPTKENLGILRIKTFNEQVNCEESMDTTSKRVREIQGIKALQFAIGPHELALDITFPNFRTTKWKIPLPEQFAASAPQLFLSSAEYRAPKVMILAPLVSSSPKKEALSKKVPHICHNISDDCQEKAPSVCDQCPSGWIEVPNGCPQGPKLCEDSICGGKHRAACRRGMKYQKAEKKFDCRTDSSFAYCSPGLNVECRGQEAWCR